MTGNSSALSGSAQSATVCENARVASSAATVVVGSWIPRDRSAAATASVMPRRLSNSRSRSSGFESSTEIRRGARSRRSGVNQSAAMSANPVSIASRAVCSGGAFSMPSARRDASPSCPPKQDSALVAEVPEERAPRQPCGRRDLFNGGVVVALLGEQLYRSSFESGARVWLPPWHAITIA
jgi:hypothetical protein